MSLDSLCRWQVQVSVYCAWRIPAHLRCTQCSILLHLMDICFLTCICLWQISQIQTFLFKVVGPGLVSTSPAFVSSSASHPAGPPLVGCVVWSLTYSSVLHLPEFFHLTSDSPRTSNLKRIASLVMHSSTFHVAIIFFFRRLHAVTG